MRHDADIDKVAHRRFILVGLRHPIRIRLRRYQLDLGLRIAILIQVPGHPLGHVGRVLGLLRSAQSVSALRAGEVHIHAEQVGGR